VQLKIIADTTHLAPGSYSGTVTVQGTTSKSVVTVNLIVSGVSITANPKPHQPGLVKPQKQTSALSITSVGGSTTVNVWNSHQRGPGRRLVDGRFSSSRCRRGRYYPRHRGRQSAEAGPYQGTVTLQCSRRIPV